MGGSIHDWFLCLVCLHPNHRHCGQLGSQQPASCSDGPFCILSAQRALSLPHLYLATNQVVWVSTVLGPSDWFQWVYITIAVFFGLYLVIGLAGIVILATQYRAGKFTAPEAYLSLPLAMQPEHVKKSVNSQPVPMQMMAIPQLNASTYNAINHNGNSLLHNSIRDATDCDWCLLSFNP